MQTVEWRQKNNGCKWKFCLRVTASDKSSPMLRPRSSLLVPHSSYKNCTKESRLQLLQLLPTTPCIVRWTSKSSCGCGCHQCTFYLLIPQKQNVNYNHQLPKRWLCVNAPSDVPSYSGAGALIFFIFNLNTSANLAY